MTKASIPHVFMNVSIWAEFATPHMMVDIILNSDAHQPGPNQMQMSTFEALKEMLTIDEEVGS